MFRGLDHPVVGEQTVMDPVYFVAVGVLVPELAVLRCGLTTVHALVFLVESVGITRLDLEVVLRTSWLRGWDLRGHW
jgi:hypothetical protein